MQKYDLDDARPILERASARETAARVALGAVARAFLQQSVGITLLSHVVSIGQVRIPEGTTLPTDADMDRIDADPVRCADPATSLKMIAEIEAEHSDGDTLGGD
jgi:chorismate synthase